MVAAAYKEKSGEANLRSEDDLKRNWVRKLCNNMKKPTGRSGDGQTDRINRCIEIQRKILDKSASGILGASSDDDNRFVPSSPSLSLLSSSLDGEIKEQSFRHLLYPFRPTMLLNQWMAMKPLLTLKPLLMRKPPVVLHLLVH